MTNLLNSITGAVAIATGSAAQIPRSGFLTDARQLLLFPLVVAIAAPFAWYFISRFLEARSKRTETADMAQRICDSLMQTTIMGYTDATSRAVGLRVPNHTEHEVTIQEVAFLTLLAETELRTVKGRFALDFVRLSPARADISDVVVNPQNAGGPMPVPALHSRAPIALLPHTEGLWVHRAPKQADYHRQQNVRDWEIIYTFADSAGRTQRGQARSGQNVQFLYNAIVKMN